MASPWLHDLSEEERSEIFEEIQRELGLLPKLNEKQQFISKVERFSQLYREIRIMWNKHSRNRLTKDQELIGPYFNNVLTEVNGHHLEIDEKMLAKWIEPKAKSLAE